MATWSPYRPVAVHFLTARQIAPDRHRLRRRAAGLARFASMSTEGVSAGTTTAPAKARPSAGASSGRSSTSEVITSGLCTGCAGCVISCPHDVIGYDHEAGRLQAVPPRGRARPRQLHPRREGLHQLHPGLPPLPAVGAPGQRAPLRPRPRADDEVAGIYTDILLTRASDDMVHQMGQDGGLVSAILIWAMERGLHRRRPHLLPRGRRPASWKADARRGHQPRRDPGRGRQPLHLLGQHAGHRRGARDGASRSWRWSA